MIRYDSNIYDLDTILNIAQWSGVCHRSGIVCFVPNAASRRHRSGNSALRDGEQNNPEKVVSGVILDQVVNFLRVAG